MDRKLIEEAVNSSRLKGYLGQEYGTYEVKKEEEKAKKTDEFSISYSERCA